MNKVAVSIRCYESLVWAFGLMCFVCSASADESDISLGQRIYREGLGVSGEAIAANVQGGIEFTGSQVACVSCHRRSGLGTSESDVVALPVTRDHLFRPKELGRRGQFRIKVQGAGTRPAYTDESLKRAIRQGIDPAGHKLAPLMPRYTLNDADADALVAYLKTLGIQDVPGVSDTEIHFATVVTEGVDPAEKKAMLDVLNIYIQGINAGTRHEGKRARFAPWHRDWKYQAYRTWVLDVWTLTGPERTWADQLDGYYQAKPIFAMISGLSNRGWMPVHEFCELNNIPCLFPNTDEPVASNTNYQSFYFSKGAHLKAEVLAKYLTDHPPRGSIVQIIPERSWAMSAAQVFAHSFNASGRYKIENQVVSSRGGLGEILGKLRAGDDAVSTRIVWLDDLDIEALGPVLRETKQQGQVFVVAKRTSLQPGLLTSLNGSGSFLVYPYELPERLANNLRRSNAWLSLKKIQSQYAGLQANTFFTASVVGAAVRRMRENFSRDYFMEIIEHTIEKSLVKSVYPRSSLGPGQRYAAKGAYLLKFSSDPEQSAMAQVDWIVP